MTEINGETSDGYHTFNELYGFRLAYNAVLFNEWTRQGRYDVHKSWRHSDGELCFGGGWFIVVAQLPSGQISQHYHANHWPLFDAPKRERGATWDGHTPQDVLDRLAEFLSLPAERRILPDTAEDETVRRLVVVFETAWHAAEAGMRMDAGVRAVLAELSKGDD